MTEQLPTPAMMPRPVAGGTRKPPTELSMLLSVITSEAQNLDTEKMQQMIAMYNAIKDRGAQEAFDLAMNEAQAEMRAIATDSANPQTKSRYASYAALDRVLRPIYTKHGFSLSFNVSESTPETVTVTCRVSHGVGHRMYSIPMPADGRGPKGNEVMSKTHATGSAVTYGMRYLLRMIFNVAVGEFDDDGNGASDKAPRITEEQVALLREALEANGKSLPKFLTWAKIDSLQELPADYYDSALKAIAAKPDETKP